MQNGEGEKRNSGVLVFGPSSVVETFYISSCTVEELQGFPPFPFLNERCWIWLFHGRQEGRPKLEHFVCHLVLVNLCLLIMCYLTVKL